MPICLPAVQCPNCRPLQTVYQALLRECELSLILICLYWAAVVMRCNYVTTVVLNCVTVTVGLIGILECQVMTDSSGIAPGSIVYTDMYNMVILTFCLWYATTAVVMADCFPVF